METIKDFENYQIDIEGNIYSKKRNGFLKPLIDSTGYLRLDLHKDGKRYACRIHRLLALQFIPNPDNLPVVDHIDRNRLNNSLDNLRWATRSQNGRNRNCKGYTWDKQANKYQVQYMLNRKNIHIGHYDTEEEARVAYLNAIKDL